MSGSARAAGGVLWRVALAGVGLVAGCGTAGSPSMTDDGGSTTGEATAATTHADGSTSTSGDASSSGGAADTTAADDSTGMAPTTGGGVMLRGACALADRVGSFDLVMEASYTSFSGSVADGVVPVTVLEQVAQDGDCVLLRRNNPFCDPLCLPGQTCDFDGMCIPYPENHDVGTVSVTGLLAPVMVDPIAPTYAYFDTTLPHPGFDPDAPIVLTAQGGDYTPFVLHGSGVAMVEPTASEVTLDTGSAVSIEWSPSGSAASLRLVMSVDQHGLSPVQLVCEAADTGSLSISAEIINEFLAAGISGFPSADYFLRTADSVDLEPGCVEFIVRSHVQTPLNVAGHTPCDAPNDCPIDQTCDLMNQTCV